MTLRVVAQDVSVAKAIAREGGRSRLESAVQHPVMGGLKVLTLRWLASREPAKVTRCV